MMNWRTQPRWRAPRTCPTSPTHQFSLFNLIGKNIRLAPLWMEILDPPLLWKIFMQLTLWPHYLWIINWMSRHYVYNMKTYVWPVLFKRVKLTTKAIREKDQAFRSFISTISSSVKINSWLLQMLHHIVHLFLFQNGIFTSMYMWKWTWQKYRWTLQLI